MDALIGQILQQRYKVNAILGEGGMGSVYRAHDITLQRDVAIKVMHAQFARRQDFQERFLQEARTAARVDHPGIVKVFDFGQASEILYIVMEFIPGDNLRKMLQNLKAKNQWIALPEAVGLMQQVCLAIDYVHKQGILHRDIKPDNIMLKPGPCDGLPYRPILTDLGLAKLAEGGVLTQDGSSMGTPAYMSPEQASGTKTDARSDVYSLGVLLYELAVGRLPFPAKTISDAIRYHVHEAPPEPRFLRPDLPEIVVGVMMKALQKDPAARFPNAQAMADALASTGPAVTQVSAGPTAVSDNVSLMTEYQHSLVDIRGTSLLVEFPVLSSDVSQDRIQIMDLNLNSRYVPVKKGGMTIGRTIGNDLVIDSPKVSRQHARVEFDGSHYRVSDLNTTNGTYLANVKLLPGIPEVWTPDRILRIGDYYLRLLPAQTTPLSQPYPPGRVMTRSDGTQVDPSLIRSSSGSGRVGIFMGNTQLTVAPGSSVNTTLVLLNQGNVVDHFKPVVAGTPANWLPVPPALVQLLPGTQQEVVITISPPLSPQSKAGDYRLTIQVASQDAPQEVAVTKATLFVTPFSKFNAELHPQRVQAGQAAQIVLENQGNQLEAYSIACQDREGALNFTPPQFNLSVEAGQTAAAQFSPRSMHRPLFGSAQIHPFSVQVTSTAGEAQVLSGEALSRPVLSTWLLLLIPLLCLCILIAGSILPLGPGGTPPIAAFLFSSPTPYFIPVPPGPSSSDTPMPTPQAPTLPSSITQGPTDTPAPPNDTDTPEPTFIPTLNPGLGTFQTTFNKDTEMIVVAYGSTLGGMAECGFHNLTLSDQDVGKTLTFYPRNIWIGTQGINAGDVMSAHLFRSLIGPVSAGTNFDLWNQPNAEELMVAKNAFDGIKWVVNQPGNYVLCIQTDYNLYNDPSFVLQGADYTVLLGG